MVVNAPTSNIVCAAELAVALMLAAARHVAPPTPRCRTASGSARSTPASSSTRRPSASSASAASACSSPSACSAFGMKVIAYDPYVQAGRAAQMGVRLVDLDTLLAESDFMSVHLPKTPETVGLIGAEQLATAKPSLVLVNAARGGIVDEAALYDALKNGRIAAAGLDVFAKEPCTDSPLFELENVVATPAPRRLHRRGPGEGRHRRGQVGAPRARRRAGPRRGQRPGRRHRRGRPSRHPAHREARPRLHRAGRRGRPAARRRGPRRDHRVRRQGARAGRAQGRLHRHRRGAGLLRQRAAARGRARHRGAPGDRGREPRPPQPDHHPRHPGRRHRRSRSAARWSGSPRRSGSSRSTATTIDIEPTDHLAFFTYDDRPGMVGTVGRILGDAGGQHRRHAGLAPRTRAAQALVALSVDSAIPAEALAEIETAIDAVSVRAVDLA